MTTTSTMAYWGSTEQGHQFFDQLPKLIEAINKNTEAVQVLAGQCKAPAGAKEQKEKPQEEKLKEEKLKEEKPKETKQWQDS